LDTFFRRGGGEIFLGEKVFSKKENDDDRKNN